MDNTMNTAAIQTLSTIAMNNGHIQFSHFCTAALNNEDWAVTRMQDVLDLVDGLSPAGVLEVIRTTNTDRPDGGIARTFQP